MAFHFVPAARWLRDPGRREFEEASLRRMVAAAFPGTRMLAAQPFREGLRNSNYRVELHGGAGTVVLRIFEHDRSICRKELNLLQRIGPGLPVQEVLFAAPDGLDEGPPYLCLRFVEGISLRELKRAGSPANLAEAAYSCGATLAALGGISFPCAGWIGGDGGVDAAHPQSFERAGEAVDSFLASGDLQRRVGPELRRGIESWMDTMAPAIARLPEARQLVHGDFGKSNLLLCRRNDWWTVASVLDWEFALSGSPLIDVGHLLRYERDAEPRLEPHFSRGFREAGGVLLDDWRRVARGFDLIALVESLTHATLPDGITAEIVELVKATIEDRDPASF